MMEQNTARDLNFKGSFIVKLSSEAPVAELTAAGWSVSGEQVSAFGEVGSGMGRITLRDNQGKEFKLGYNHVVEVMERGTYRTLWRNRDIS